MLDELEQALEQSMGELTKKWSEFAELHLAGLSGIANKVSELKELAAKSAHSTATSSTTTPMQQDIRQWPPRDNRGQLSSAALILTDAYSRSQMSMIVGIDYTKMSMSELHLCQLAITKEIHARDQLSQIQLGDTIKQNKMFTTRMEEVAQQKKEAEHKTTTLMRALDEACRSLSDSDIQGEEEPEQRIAKLRDYAQQSRSEIERLKTKHQHQIVELQLRIPPETPLEV